MRTVFLTSFGIAVVGVAQSAPLYNLTDLGPGSSVAINNQGVVLGQDSQGAFIYQAGQRQYVPQPAGGTFLAGAMNDLGEVVGATNFGSGFQYYLSTYVNGALTVNTALPDLDPVAINNAGQITGIEVSKYQSFFYSGGTVTPIPNQPNVIEPISRAMNSSGVVTGVFYPSQSSSQQTFVFSNGQFNQIRAPGTFSIVGGINDSGVIAGSYGTKPLSLLTAGVFTCDRTGFHNLGPAVSGFSDEEDAVRAINNAGVIVGTSEVPVSPGVVAWVYLPGTGFMNLDEVTMSNIGGLGLVLQSIAGINDAGDILAQGAINGHNEVYLLTPVPEPGTAVLFIAAIGALLSARSVRRR